MRYNFGSGRDVKAWERIEDIKERLGLEDHCESRSLEEYESRVLEESLCDAIRRAVDVRITGEQYTI